HDALSVRNYASTTCRSGRWGASSAAPGDYVGAPSLGPGGDRVTVWPIPRVSSARCRRHNVHLVHIREQLMADPLWVDSSTLIDIADGDNALEGELTVKAKAGAELLMVPKVREEFLSGMNPLKGAVAGNTPERAKARQDLLTRLGVKSDTSGSE